METVALEEMTINEITDIALKVITVLSRTYGSIKKNVNNLNKKRQWKQYQKRTRRKRKK